MRKINYSFLLPLKRLTTNIQNFMKISLFCALAIIVLWSLQSESATRPRNCARLLFVKPVGQKAYSLFENIYSNNRENFDLSTNGDTLYHLPTGLSIAYNNGEYLISLGDQAFRDIVSGHLGDYPKEDFGEDYNGINTYQILEEQFTEYGLAITSNNKKGGTIILSSPWMSFTVSAEGVRNLDMKSDAPFAKSIEFKVDLAKIPDYALGVVLPEEAKSGSGFRIGQKNSNATIRKMAQGNYSLNGMRFKDIERNMRPGEAIPKDVGDLRAVARGEGVYRDRSDNGFIASDETLLDVLIEQNNLVLQKIGTSHQKLMGPIYRMVFALRNGFISPNQVITYNGIQYKLAVIGAGMGHVYSPFGDRTRTRTKITITRVSSGQSISFSTLISEMAYRYGFYESSSRIHYLNPLDVARLMPFTK